MDGDGEERVDGNARDRDPEVPEVNTASPGARKRMRVSMMSDSPGTPPGLSADSPEAETNTGGGEEDERDEGGGGGRRINVVYNQVVYKRWKAAQLYVVAKSLKKEVTHVSAAQAVGLDETSEDSVRKHAQLYQNAGVNELRRTLAQKPLPMIFREPWMEPILDKMEEDKGEVLCASKAAESYIPAEIYLESSEAGKRFQELLAGGEKEEMSPEPDEEVDVETIQKHQEDEEDDDEDDDDDDEEGRETGPDEGPAAKRAGVAVKLEPDFDDARRTGPSSAKMDDERCVVS